MKRRISTVTILALLCGAMLLGTAALAADTADKLTWPAKTPLLVFPDKGGGAQEATCRIMSDYVQQHAGVPFTYVNNQEGNGTVAYDMVRTADKDGSKLLVCSMITFVKYYTGMYQHNPETEFTYIAAIPSNNTYAMVVRADSPHKTSQEVADYIKANPNKLICGLELGGTSHVMAGKFAKDAGGQFRYVEAGSTPSKLAALQGGHIDITYAATSAVDQYVKTGKLRILGLLTADGKRDPRFPDYPSLVDEGFANCTWQVPIIISGPKGMDEALVQSIFKTFHDACMDKESQEKFEKMNWPMWCLDSVEASVKFVEEEAASIKGVLADIGMLKQQ